MGLFKRKNEASQRINDTPTETPIATQGTTYNQQLQAEARRLHLAAMTMSANEEQKAKDARQLGEIKLDTINANIRRIHRLQQWLVTYTKLTQAITEHNERLYEANKYLTTNREKEEELERFETLETIQTLYQRLRLLEEMAQANKQTQSQQATEMATYQQAEGEAKKMMAQRTAELTESEKRLSTGMERLEQAYRILGEQTILDIDIRTLQDTFNRLTQQRDALTLEMEEHKAEHKRLQGLIDQKKEQLQALEPHRKMLTKGNQVLFCLNILSDVKAEIERINNQHKDCTQKQREENAQLEHMFAEYQHVEASILTLTSELQRHRISIAGIDSYDLQERATQQQTRHQMLLSAQALWSHIQNGYQEIDEKELELTQLKLKIDYGRRTLDTLRHEVETLRDENKRHEYELTVSKSQNIILLRSDLKEGVSCTLCGATHHPFHSDTMLEQNKLLSDMGAAYELEAVELQAKEKRLAELTRAQIELEAEESQKRAYLFIIKKQQDTFVKDWEIYNKLDRSFADCTPATNMEARAGMIRQLIVNANHDASNAQHELETYNYHQGEINKIAVTLSQKEQEKSELTVRLNEANTGCQVLTRQTNMLDEARTDAQARYTKLYEEANKTISLPDWFKEWDTNTENLKQHIGELTHNWNQLNKDIAELTQKQEVLEKGLEGFQRQDSLLDGLIQQAQKEIEQHLTLHKKGEKGYKQALEGHSADEYAEAVLQGFLSCDKAEKEQRIELAKATEQRAIAEGMKKETASLAQYIDEQISNVRIKLDLWIRQYNSTHPSIQYNDLDNYFTGQTDWNQIRKEIRKARIDVGTEQKIIEMLRDYILQMQAMASLASTDINLITSEELQTQLKQLEQQYREACMETAEHTVSLQRNEKYKTLTMGETNNGPV